MIEIKPPKPIPSECPGPRVFLAGSIEQGAAEDWQARVVGALSDLDIVVLNPRRDAWDPSWRQDISCDAFREQVEWELDAQAGADLVAFYFCPGSRAPITLLELGLAAGRRESVVCCPDGFWRKGNVDIVCRRYGIPQVATLAELIDGLRLVARPS